MINDFLLEGKRIVCLCNCALVLGLFTNCTKYLPESENLNSATLKSSNDYVPPANAIYIDPTATVNGTGTLASPLNGSTLQLQYGQPWKANGTYLLKRGSLLDVKYKLWIQANNVTLGAYGTGAMPIIRSAVDNSEKVLDAGNMSDIIIRDLEIYSTANASAIVNFMYNVRGAIINCKIHDGEWGIRNMYSSGMFRVLNCEVYNTGDDGCFITDMDSMEFAGNYVHDVNFKYKVNTSDSYSAGDVLQVGNIHYFYIHDNILDHSGTGNKFCLLLGTNVVNFQGKGIVERNVFKRDNVVPDATIFYTNYGDAINIILRDNKFENAMVAISNHSKNLQVYYNEFTNITKMCFDGAGASGTSNIYNNTFYNVANLVSTYGETVNFKNNIVYQCTGQAFVNPQYITLDYNCFYSSANLGTTSLGPHSITADPKFSNPAALDFSLQSSSPCINKGVGLLGSYISIDGYLVSQGAGVDIGAHEYLTGTQVSPVSPGTPTLPVISIISPGNGSSFKAPANITITVNASKVNGSISKVEFFNGGIKLGEITKAPYAFIWSNISAGSYVITAVATDNLNAKTTSDPTIIWVNR